MKDWVADQGLLPTLLTALGVGLLPELGVGLPPGQSPEAADRLG